jgi:uncharacterized membrane protein
MMSVEDAVQSQSEIIRKNISAISTAQRRETAALSAQEKAAGRITDLSGSMLFVYFHALWFGLWILLNIGVVHIPHLTPFDPYPFGLLTLVVSLEAIFLSTFVLIAQNRMARQSQQRAELDLQINLLSEQKAAKVLELLDQIVQQLDKSSSKFHLIPDVEIDALKRSPQPEEVLKVIEDSVKEEAGAVHPEGAKTAREIGAQPDATREDISHVRRKVDEEIKEKFT